MIPRFLISDPACKFTGLHFSPALQRASYSTARKSVGATCQLEQHLPPASLALPLLQAETLLLDGCFLVEFFLKAEEAADDAAWAMQNVYNDLFLLEKQLPFFVVERFYELATGRGTDRLVGDGPREVHHRGHGRRRPPDEEIHHLLHLYYHWFLRRRRTRNRVRRRRRTRRF
jgi:hypothetical protein